ncbi:UBC6 [Candida oxycetoniae]|uniref:Ubiquitin-conjugating enzyme E2 6 n=1 Tax=Candida oxycetoniae TaxID=497107 RepID=A0AAI9T113_9ASCO|nr:UBC6 [Candida oxycetoniae]KAI3406256.2 UBC6 [Candida oxycetoniae]
MKSSKRLHKEYMNIQKSPPPYITAKPNDENILEWHYIISGPKNTIFEDGQYHGILRFPTEYPFKPPSISMITPNGRFAVNTRLCLSMSDYHPNTWNPAWSVATILTGLLSFMTGNEQTTGSISTSDNVKRKLARDSLKWNIKENPRFVKQFPDLVKSNKEEIARREEEEEEERKKKQINDAESGEDGVRSSSGNGSGGGIGGYVELSQLNKLDPEERARILIEHERKLAMLKTRNSSSNNNGVFRYLLSGGGITALVVLVVATTVAIYFNIFESAGLR